MTQGNFAAFLVLLAITMFPLRTVGAQTQSKVNARLLTSDEALLMARAVLTPQLRALPNFSLKLHKIKKPLDWYFFDLIMKETDHPVLDGIVLGGVVLKLAVDAKTGYVWSSVVCRQFSSPELTTLQRTFWKEAGIKRKYITEYLSRGPAC